MTPSLRLDFTAPPWVWDLLTHLWQSTAVALAILVLISLGRGISARTRRTLGWIAVAKFALPAAWIAKIVQQAGGQPTSWLATDALLLPVSLAPAVAADGPSVASIPVARLLALIWVLGSAGLLACWIAQVMRVRRRILATANPVPEWLTQRVEGAAACVGLNQAPRCAIVSPEYGPGLVGVASPVLVLPHGLADVLAPAELDSILIHECVHLQRRDNLWSTVRAVFVALLWHNPIAWLLNRAIGLETEKSCDERVLEITGDADAYAKSIVASVRHSLGMLQPGFSGATTPPVLGRIKAILAYPARRERRTIRWSVLLASIGLAALSGRAGSIAAETAPPRPVPPVTPTAAPSDAAAPGAKPVPRYKVGKITIKFVGPTDANEQFVRDNMQIREGGEFDEVTLDRDIRSIYRTGRFKFVEVKHEPAGDKAFDLVITVTPKPVAETVTPPGPAGELSETRQKLDNAKTRLEKLREEQAALTQKKQSDGAKGGVTVSIAPGAVVPGSPPSSVSGVPRQAPQTYNDKPVYDIRSLNRTPVPRFQARPQYPFAMRKAGVAGEAVVDFIVDDKGDVVSAFAIRSSQVEFEAAAVAAVSKWKFRPGQKNGRDVHTHMQVPIVFTLNER